MMHVVKPEGAQGGVGGSICIRNNPGTAMEEQEYLRTDGVLVTSTRIEINGQTFAVRNVGSVKTIGAGNAYLAVLVLIGCMLAALAGQGWGYWLGVVLAAGWIWETKRTRRLVLVTTGGEVMALQSRKRGQVEAVSKAIVQAIATR